MKTLITILLTAFILYGCGRKARTEKTTTWINTHPKPIVTTIVTRNEIGVRYTLIDSSGVIFNTGLIRAMILPDTIRPFRPLK
jgi:hypothetical protein